MTLNVVFDIGPSLLSLGAKIVATLSDFTTKLDAIAATTAQIKAEIDDLKAQLASGGLSSSEEQTVLDRLDQLETGLTALLPTPTPTPTP